MTEPESESLRLDKWLWYARFCKSRTVATQLCRSGGVRVNKARINKPNRQIHIGDVLTFPAGPHVRVVEVLALGARRGPAPEARTLYADMIAYDSPDRRPRLGSLVAAREPGSGRPTKRDRRVLARWKDRSLKPSK